MERKEPETKYQGLDGVLYDTQEKQRIANTAYLAGCLAGYPAIPKELLFTNKLIALARSHKPVSYYAGRNRHQDNPPRIADKLLELDKKDNHAYPENRFNRRQYNVEKPVSHDFREPYVLNSKTDPNSPSFQESLIRLESSLGVIFEQLRTKGEEATIEGILSTPELKNILNSFIGPDSTEKK